MYNDINYAFRMLKKTPGFSALTLLVISVGLGLAIYMFAIVNLFAYKSLDITEYDRLVVADSIVDGFEQNGGSIYPHDYKFIAAQQKSFEVFSAYTHSSSIVSDGTTAKRYESALFELDAFNLFDANKSLAMGRLFEPSDSHEGSEDVAIISDNLWKDYFDGDANIIGRQILLDGNSTKVIGVMKPGYAYPMNQDIWLPLNLSDTYKPGQGWQVSIAGRLKENMSLDQAQAELKSYASELSKQFPESNATVGIFVRSPVKMMMDNSMSIIYLMIGATAFVLILVVVNVANLMLARASERSKELAIRTALGAPKSRIVRQMLLETLLICVIGGVFGVLMAGWALEATKPIFMKMGGWVAPWWTFTLGSEELLAALWIVLGTALLIALFPVLKSSDADINQVLRDGTRGALGKKAGRMNKLLISAEIFLSCSVLIVAGALIIGVNQAIKADYGAKSEGILAATFMLDTDQYLEQADRRLFMNKFIEGLEQQEGVLSVTIGSALPGRTSGREPIRIEGAEVVKGSSNRSMFLTIQDNYFSTLDVPLLEGRFFDDRDNADSQPVIIVSSEFAKKYFPDGSAIGKRIKVRPNDEARQWRTIIGVVGQVVHAQPFGDAFVKPAVYVPNSQLAYRWQNVAMQVQGDPYSYQKVLREVAGKIDANIPLFNVLPLDERLYRRVMGMQFVGRLFVFFGVLSLLLAAAGIYGVMSQNVTRRTQEFGVRRALGAPDSHIYRLLAKQSGLLLAIGGTLGGVVGYMGVKVISGNLMNLSGYFPTVSIIVMVTIALTTFLATLIPAVKALSVEPNSALRYE